MQVIRRCRYLILFVLMMAATVIRADIRGNGISFSFPKSAALEQYRKSSNGIVFRSHIRTADGIGWQYCITRFNKKLFLIELLADGNFVSAFSMKSGNRIVKHQCKLLYGEEQINITLKCTNEKKKYFQISQEFFRNIPEYLKAEKASVLERLRREHIDEVRSDLIRLMRQLPGDGDMRDAGSNYLASGMRLSLDGHSNEITAVRHKTLHVSGAIKAPAGLQHLWWTRKNESQRKIPTSMVNRKYRFNFTLTPNASQFVVIRAEDNNNRIIEREVDIHCITQPSCVRVLVCTASHYGPGITSLPDTKLDQQNVSRFFLQLDHTTVKSLPHCSRDTLLSEGLPFLRASKPDELAILYYAGHGEQKIGTTGTQYSLVMEPETTGQQCTRFSYYELIQEMAALPATGSIVILDNCHSGAIADQLANPFMVTGKMQSLLQNMLIIAGSNPFQQTVGDESIGGGLFTHHLIRWLSSAQRFGNATVTVGDIRTHFRENPNLELPQSGNKRSARATDFVVYLDDPSDTDQGKIQSLNGFRETVMVAGHLPDNLKIIDLSRGGNR